ncbi:MAG TPA: hypothetical protein VL443_29790 [Cyclobacteriaceae bacterium]|jgi:hypothetical protein|nr:hypothetical protein [Cyclobacteriaceae bacterium]
MELLESGDPKSQLLKKAAMQRGALEEEAKLISDRTQKVIVNALVIGGALAATYFLVRQFSGSKKKSKSKPGRIKLVSSREADDDAEEVTEVKVPGVVAQIGTALASQATVFLLTLAKEKLAEYMESQAQKKTENK